MALYPFIFVRDKKLRGNAEFINHEKIHLRQQAEMLVLPFYIWYIIEYLFLLLKFRDKKKAYRNISFEKEAYANQADTTYLKQRPLWNFIKYFS